MAYPAYVRSGLWLHVTALGVWAKFTSAAKLKLANTLSKFHYLISFSQMKFSQACCSFEPVDQTQRQLAR